MENYNPISIKEKVFIHMREPLVEGVDYYLNEQGYKVFTKEYHLKRGYCCKNGCKHCAYGYNKKTDKIEKDAVKK